MTQPLDVSIVGWVAIVITLIGAYFNARKDARCWKIWIFSSILWIYFNLRLWLPQPVLINLVFSVINIYGLRNWGKDKK